MHWEQVWTGRGFASASLRAALTPASWLYAFGWQAYASLYRLGLKQPIHPHSPVIVIGNLLVGGTGKSPVTIHVADVLRNLGLDVVVGCSGYSSPAAEAAQLAPDGDLRASEWGDEAAMIRWLRPDLPLVVGRRRVLAAQLVHQLPGPPRVLLMDDGFQHLPLHKDLSLLLDPPGPNQRCLPAGPYREPRSNRKRADLVLPGQFHVEPLPGRCARPDGETVPWPQHAHVLCALGRPQSFLESLRENNVQPQHTLLKPDHDSLAEGNLLASFSTGLPILVTAKDWVKLRERRDVEKHNILIAHRDVKIEPADQFREWLKTKLNGIQTQRP